MSYGVFMVDPPWPKKKGGKRAVRPAQGRELDYATMNVDDIFNLLDFEVLAEAQEQHVVYLWTVDEFLHVAENEMTRRGYRMHARLVWDKQNGVAPAFSLRYCHEYLLWFYKPKFLPVAEASRGKLGSVLTEKSRQHSRKPNKAYEIVEAWYPSERKMDVFSREKRAGWAQFGDQKEHFNPRGAQ